MSINITVHGSPVNTFNKTNFLVDPELARKKEFEERRKLRLQQVRKKSNEIASQLRHNVEYENKKQFERIDRLKKDELLRWREKATAEAKCNYENRLKDVGLAHTAAEQEREKLLPCTTAQNSNRKRLSSATTGKSKTPQKVIATTIKPKTYHRYTTKSPSLPVHKKKHLKQKKISHRSSVNDENSSNVENVIRTQNERFKDKKNSPEIREEIDDEISCSSSDEKTITNSISSPSPSKQRKSTQKIQNSLNSKASSLKQRKSPKKTYSKLGKIAQTPAVVMEIDSQSDSSLSQMEIEDTHDSSNMHYSRITSKYKSPSSSPSHNRSSKVRKKHECSYHGAHPISISSLFTKPAQPPTRFTQISDLIRQKSQEEQQFDLTHGRLSRKEISPRRYQLKTKFDDIDDPKTICQVTRSTSVSPTRKYDRSPLQSPTRNLVKSTPSSPNKQQQTQLTPCFPKKQRQINVAETKSVGISSSPRKFIGSHAPSIASKKYDKTSLKSSMKSSQNYLSQKDQQVCNNGAGQRVQFYDYNNKFQKTYEPSKIVQSEKTSNGLNAMERAEIEREFEEHRQKEQEIARMKSDERCQRALQREQVRRDYEALTAKLDSISQDKNLQQKCYGNTAYLTSDVRIKNAEEQKQRKLNAEIADILQRPVLITCPDVKNDKNTNLTKQNYDNANFKYLSNLNLATDDNFTLNTSSDSCTSILLNYVSDQTKKVSEDIANCDSMQKIKRLQMLLDRINNLRNKLLTELKIYKDLPYKKENFQEFVDSINSFEVEREKIIGKKIKNTHKQELHDNMKKSKEQIIINDDKKRTENKLEKREIELKRKEAILEKKLRDFYKESKIHEKEGKEDEFSSVSTSQIEVTTDDLENNTGNGSTNESEPEAVMTTEKIITKKPIEIVIKVKNQQTRKTPIKSPFKVSRKRVVGVKRKRKAQTPKVILTQHIPPAIDIPPKTLSPIKANLHVQREEGSTITSYRSPPFQVQTPLGRALDTNKMMIDGDDKTKEPQKTESKKDKTKELPSRSKTAAVPVPVIHPKININPQLGHYIQRLLGMSHHAIKMLGVSSSEIETPSSSIINNSANVSAAATTESSDSFERSKIEQLKKFIQDNYKFLEDINESMKKDTSTISSDSNEMKTIEKIWKQTLKCKRKETEVKTKKQIKPILKKIKTPKKTIYPEPFVLDDTERLKSSPPIKEITPKKAKRVSPERKEKLKSPEPKEKSASRKEPKDSKKLELVGKYTELAEHCTQRIAELNEMILKVREEKQKILEITLSSPGDTARTSTEYADIYDKNALDRSGSSKVSDKKPTTSPLARSPEKIPLEKHKVTGMSRDSGISLSRPVTALGNRESPELPSSSVQEDFEPVLKNIPKPTTATQLPPPPPPAVQIISPSPQSMTETGSTSTAKLRKEKPPTSLGRYSPQFGDELQPPHELSTIAEVDTPATSRLNNSAITEKQQDKSTADNLLEAEKIENEMVYKKFPSFHEYVKQNKLDLTVLDGNTISQLQEEYEEMVNKIEKSHGKIENGKTEDLNNEIKNLVESLKKFNLSFKKFPTRKEYLEQIGATDLIDSKSIDDLTETIISENVPRYRDLDSDLDTLDSAESLLDVVKELKRRNMIQCSFQYDDAPEKLEKKASELEVDAEKTSNSERHLTEGKLLKLLENKSTKKQKVDDHSGLSGIETIPPSASSRSNSDNIERDLKEMGLTWAAAMMKKSGENRREFASTSSSIKSPQKRVSPRKPKLSNLSKTLRQEFSDITNDSTSIDLGTGRQLNLREFLAKELQKRTSNSTSTASIDDGDASSITSRFLQSLLGSSGSRSSSKRSTTRDGKSNDHVKTSTPVITTRSTTNSPLQSHFSDSHSQKFFSNDSRPSSIQLISSNSSNRSVEGDHDVENENLNGTNRQSS